MGGVLASGFSFGVSAEEYEIAPVTSGVFSAELEAQHAKFMSDNNLIEIPATRSSDLSHVTASLVDETGKNFASEIKTTLCREATYDVLNFGVEPKMTAVVTARSNQIATGSETSSVGDVLATGSITYYTSFPHIFFESVSGSWVPQSGPAGLYLESPMYGCSIDFGSGGSSTPNYAVSGTSFYNNNISLHGATLFLRTHVTVNYYADVKYLELRVSTY